MQFRHAFANYTSAVWDLLRILMITYDFKQAMTWSPGLLFMIYWLVAHLRAVLLMYHPLLPSPAPLLVSQMICI